jgi:hypothetical protein
VATAGTGSQTIDATWRALLQPGDLVVVSDFGENNLVKISSVNDGGGNPITISYTALQTDGSRSSRVSYFKVPAAGIATTWVMGSDQNNHAIVATAFRNLAGTPSSVVQGTTPTPTRVPPAATGAFEIIACGTYTGAAGVYTPSPTNGSAARHAINVAGPGSGQCWRGIAPSVSNNMTFICGSSAFVMFSNQMIFEAG